MELNEIITVIREFDGIKRKHNLSDLVRPLKETLDLGRINVVADFGEDSAVFSLPNFTDHYFLMALDGIWHKLISADPELAGYFSILVNANDIYCKGGTPIAMVNNLGYIDIETGNKIIRGIIKGCKKFGIPMVGGHTHPNEAINSLAVAVLGIVRKEDIILSTTAKVGDKIIMAIDLDGKFNEKFVYAWDTTNHKSSGQVQKICGTMNELARNKLLTAAKDISNPGNIGTLSMLLEYSRVGAILDIEKIPIPENIDIKRWIMAYPGFGIVCTAKEENVKRCIKIFTENGIAANECGIIISEKKLELVYKNEKRVLFDFNHDKILGF